MPPAPTRRVTMELYATTFSKDNNAPGPVACITCGQGLDLHQPDPELPERLLGICEGCGRWHITEFTPAIERGSLVCLPTPEELQSAIGR